MTTTGALDDVDPADWTEGLARAGLVARGIVYLTFGVIAVGLATSGSTKGEEASTSGAFGELAEKPFGTWLVGITALGLACWAASCLVAAATGRNGSKPGPSEPKDRAKDVVRGVVSLALALAAVQVLLQDQPGEGASGGGQQEQEATGRLMDAPAGQLLVGVVGLIILGIGLYHGVKALKQRYLEHVDLGCMGSRVPRKLLEGLGLVGHVGRGLVFAIVGGFLVKAAATHDPDEGRGIDGGLRQLSEGGPGRLLLAVTAVGVVCFGLWTLVEARCRRADV